MADSARVLIEGQVLSIKEFKTATGVGHEVTLLQSPMPGDARSQAQLVPVALFNGAMKDVKLGQTVKLMVTASLRPGKEGSRPDGSRFSYPPKLGLAAF